MVHLRCRCRLAPNRDQRAVVLQLLHVLARCFVLVVRDDKDQTKERRQPRAGYVRNFLHAAKRVSAMEVLLEPDGIEWKAFGDAVRCASRSAAHLGVWIS